MSDSSPIENRGENGELLDTAFETLASARCRYALRILDGPDPPVSLADFARELAAVEEDTPPERVSTESVREVHISLRHSQVPKLADRGFVRFDPERDTVGLTEEGKQVVRILEFMTPE